ncbi:MAG: restriction endonuclease subunit S, partial [Aeromonas sp.]
VPGINRNHIHKAKVKIPKSVTYQQAIAKKLRDLDNKITLNRQINQTLEQMAQALFKSWFVDFDPVIDNALEAGFFDQAAMAQEQGQEPPFADELLRRVAARQALRASPDVGAKQTLPAATRQLFPAAFELCADPALGLGGWIPKGWHVRKLENLMELAYGKALKSTDRIDGHVPVYGSGGITGYHNEPLVDGPSIIVGRKGTVGSLYWEDKPFFPIDTVFYVRSEKPLTYCFSLLQTLGLTEMNTDAAVPGLNRNNAYRLQVIAPDDDVLNVFDTFSATLRQRIFTNAEQMKNLTNLRDTLLPKLISGELRLDQIGTSPANEGVA